jgi:hypothetical protein
MDPKRQLLRKSGLGIRGKLKDLLGPGTQRLGQSYPQQDPYPEGKDTAQLTEPLGAPLSIKEAAHVIGCSAWTVRQRYLPAGLPHHRLSPNGKLIFYRNQVIRWLLTRQQKGGTLS